MGKFFSEVFFSIWGNRDEAIVDILSRLWDKDLLNVGRDRELMAIIEEAEKSGVTVSLPLEWVDARHGNMGLYDEAAQFEVKPPCFRIKKYGKAEELVKNVEIGLGVERKIFELYLTRRRKS